MKTILSLLIVLFGISRASAAVLVVSDIDDTVKVSHVLSWGGVGSVFSSEAFWGMPDLYRALAAPPVSASFFYVSTAPKEVMGGSHEDFVRTNGFPMGPVLLEPWFLESDFKERTIRAILERNKPTDVIFLGDNGQRDPLVYEKMVQEFAPKGVRFAVFIRQAYSHASGATPLRPGQIPFVTAGEIALTLFQANMLAGDATSSVISVSFNRPGARWAELERYYPGASLGLPDWTDCRDHQVQVPANPALFEATKTFLGKIYQRCQTVIDE